MSCGVTLNAASEIIPLFFSILAVAVILYLCYLLSRFLAKKAGSIANSANIKILERVALTQDKGLVIVEICSVYYLIAFSNNRVEILKELDPAQLHQPESGGKQNFMDALNTVIKGRLDLTGNDSKQRIDKK